MSLAKRLGKLEAALRPPKPHLVYCLGEWGHDDSSRGFEEHEDASHYEEIALDRLVAAGWIRDCDRKDVTFIVRRIVSPSFKIEIDEDGSERVVWP